MNTEPKEIPTPRSYDEVVAYIRSLKVGERVMETERSSALFGRCGTVYIGHQDSICVRWDSRHDEDGSMGSSCTEGARRVTELSEANARLHELSLGKEAGQIIDQWRERDGAGFRDVSLGHLQARIQAALALSEAKIAEKDAALKLFGEWRRLVADAPPQVDSQEKFMARVQVLMQAREAAGKALSTTGQEWAERLAGAEKDREWYRDLLTGIQNALSGVPHYDENEKTESGCVRGWGVPERIEWVKKERDAALSRCRELEEARTWTPTQISLEVEEIVTANMQRNPQLLQTISDGGESMFKGYCCGLVTQLIARNPALSAPAVEKADPQPHKEPEIHTRFEP